MPSEQQTSTTPEDETDLWRTPPWLFRYLNARYGPFDVDLAANSTNALCQLYVTKEQNTLSMPWSSLGTRGFINPPFSDPDPFVRHAYIEAQHNGFSTAIILPTHRNQKWAAFAQYATERIEFEGRVNFMKPDGSEKNANRNGTMVYYFRAYDLGFTRTVWVNTQELKKRYEGAVA